MDITIIILIGALLISITYGIKEHVLKNMWKDVHSSDKRIQELNNKLIKNYSDKVRIQSEIINILEDRLKLLESRIEDLTIMNEITNDN